jgi:predicted ATPase/signal transduction histidine kinase
MRCLPGYKIRQKIYESNNSMVFRATKENTDKDVVIKILKEEYPDPERIMRFKKEYENLKEINLDGIIKVYCIEKISKRWALITEDFGAESLRKIMQINKLSILDFLKLSVSVTDTMCQLSKLNIIHNKINPTNIVWNRETGQVKLIDFGSSTILRREIAAIQNLDESEGLLSYISPEQTGRMNRMVDYRTDMYSLGVTLYELLSGQLPFPSSDVMEIIHCHLARNPVHPHLIRSVLPGEKADDFGILSKIIIKLMSKTAEDRYLSFFGLRSDLKRCLDYLENNHTLSGLDFHPGENDFSDRFQIPQKLYGREIETKLLLDAFNRVTDISGSGQGGELIIVSGYTGIGKSALVNEIHIPIVEKKGLFVSGKYDRFKHNIPYSAIVIAFQDLIRQILMGSEAQINHWKSKILDAVGPNGQVIIDVIPEVERIIGKQPSVPYLPSRETQNRFYLYFLNFIETFADASHPLALFLDDLQWADTPSLKLLERLILDLKARYLLIIGAYRDNEVDSLHPLIQTLNRLKRGNIVINYITLYPLDSEQIRHLISDSLRCNIEDSEIIVKICLEKTSGNPFFLIQFLDSLAEKNLIRFNTENLKWEWDEEAIKYTDITTNVVDLMTSKIQMMSEKAIRILKLASCIGTSFDLESLSIINEKSFEETAGELNEALESGLIQPIGKSYRLAGYLDILTDQNYFERQKHKIPYKFLHDRVHQAVGSLMGDNFKEIHHQVGMLLLRKLPEEEREERIFDITNLLNTGVDLIHDEKEKTRLAVLNMQAGRKAKAATAYETAYQYFNTGLALIGSDAWDNDYDLTLDLNIEGAEAAYLTGNFDRTDEIAREIIDHAKSLLDRIRINEIVIQSFMARDRLEESIAIAVEILKQLGVHINQKPGKLSVILNIYYLRLILFSKKMEDLKNLPVMTDPYKLAAMRMLMNAASSAYYNNILLSITIAVKMIQLSIRYGNSSFSSFGYQLYGIILQSIVGQILKGYRFGEFSIEILNRFDAREYQSRINFIFNVFIRHWKDKLSDTIEPFRESFQRGLETGDYEFGCLNSAYVGIHLFHSGERIQVAEEEMYRSLKIAAKLKQEVIMIGLKCNMQVAHNLMGRSKYRTILKGESYDEEEMRPYLIMKKNMADLGSLAYLKSLLIVMFDESKGNIVLALESEKYKSHTIGLIYRILIFFYSSFIYLANLEDASLVKKLLYRYRISKNQKQLLKWAKYAPENLMHKWHLVEAERYKYRGRFIKAMKHYDLAISLAKKSGYIQEEALANEMMAKYNLSLGNERIALAYMREAHYLYSLWGAQAKVDQINENYPELVFVSPEKSRKEDSNSNLFQATSMNFPEGLDLETVQKASQAISGEIHMDKLLEKLMHIVIANAGAQRGHFLLKTEEGLFIEGEAVAGDDQVHVLQHVPFSESPDVAQVIINYVLRTNKTVVLDDATDHGNFKTDEYIRRKKLRSVFCLPLIFQNKLTGILYLENNLASGAFTAHIMQVMNILSAQIVISVENARLYSSLEEYNRNLEAKVENRTMEISQKNQELRIQKEELRTTLDHLKKSQFQLIQAEKMASLGQLVAGIAHEINNPVNFINAGVDSLNINLAEIRQVMDIYHEITSKNVDSKLKEIENFKEKVGYTETLAEIEKLISSIKNGTKRTSEIVKGLRTFSRMDEDIIRIADVHEGLDSTIVLLQNRFKNRIEIIKNYMEIPQIECYPGQLNQVFMNILSNAIDSIDGNGSIIIETSREEGMIRISIKDTGRGIPENVKEKIYEPFYTTKEVGKGTGLGLSISHGIIEKHNGRITFTSEVGKGSEFIITLPVKHG